MLLTQSQAINNLQYLFGSNRGKNANYTNTILAAERQGKTLMLQFLLLTF